MIISSQAKQFNIPNLDDFSINEIDYVKLAFDLYKLAEYCRIKGDAMHNRKIEKIEIAIALEEELEIIYKGLPIAWRW